MEGTLKKDAIPPGFYVASKKELGDEDKIFFDTKSNRPVLKEGNKVIEHAFQDHIYLVFRVEWLSPPKK